jgi:hypothetical protein
MDIQAEHDARIKKQMAVVEGDLRLDTPFGRALTDFLKMGDTFREADRQWVNAAEETKRPASQAELFSSLYATRFYKLLNLGLFSRMLEAEIAGGNTSQSVQTTHEVIAARLVEEGSALEKELNYRVLPIRSLVGVQTCAGLATAAYLNKA